MKPGKPLAFGRRGRTLVFGLPGNPVSAMVTFEVFVRPALRALQGLAPLPVTLPARAAVAISKQPGLRLFVRATWEVRGAEIWVTPVASQSSGSLSSASGATCLIEVPEESGNLEIGSHCQLLPVSWVKG
jgi:molybdopterin molybdotransferase